MNYFAEIQQQKKKQKKFIFTKLQIIFCGFKRYITSQISILLDKIDLDFEKPLILLEKATFFRALLVRFV